MSRKRIIQLVCVLGSFGALVWLLHRVGWSTIHRAVLTMGWLSAVLLLLLAFAEGCLDGLALRIVAGKSIRTSFAIVVNSAGSLLNLVLPWESGEILKGSLINGPLGTSTAVSSVLIWNYVFKLSRPAFALLAALAALYLNSDVPASTLRLVVAANLAGFLPYLILRVAIHFGATGKLINLIRYLPVLRRSPAEWVALARNVDEQVKRFWNDRPVAYIQVFVLQFVARSTGCLSLLVGFRAIGLPYGLAQATLLHATMNVAEYLIGLLPARVGVGESTAYVVFKLYGFDASLGLVLYTVLRVRNILLHGCIAPFAFVGRRRTAVLGSDRTSPAVDQTGHE